jgi:glycosyltransferase involved in cell wall biosynthesis
MPVHNGEAYLHEALGSILGQTFSDFEIIVVDDQSTDASHEILRDYEARDSRVRVVVHHERAGVATALNTGIARATAPLVARMDADDVARPERFAMQIVEMDRDPSLGLLGAQIQVIGHEGAPEATHPWVLPLTHDETVWRLLYGSSICHPTVMMRTHVVRDLGGYDPRFANEDMELWTRMAFVTRMRNLDTVLLGYRMPSEVHFVKSVQWQPHITRVSRRYLERIVGVPVAESVVRALRGIHTDRESDDAFAVLAALGAASLLVQSFARMQILGMLGGDGLQRVSELMLSEVQELATVAHKHVAGGV